MTQGFYDLLGIARDANPGDIKKAFKHAALRHHPDKGGDTESFQKVQQALETLTDDNRRASYDRSLVRNRATDGLNPARANPVAFKRNSAASNSTNAGGNSNKDSSGPGAVEIPSNPSSLSSKELKELLSRLGVRCDDCLEKQDLLSRLSNRKLFQRGATNANLDAMGHARPYPRAAPPAAATATAASTYSAPTNVKKRLRLKIVSLGNEHVGTL